MNRRVAGTAGTASVAGTAGGATGAGRAGGGWRHRIAPSAFGLLAVAVFVFYQYVMPNLDSAARTGVRHWMPLISINEALVWVICALGLNIVVGYAGLLDLGFVAFWAIGGYTAGWLMSGFFDRLKISVGGTTPSGSPGIHVNFWLVLVAGAVVCAFFGILIGAPTLRLRSDYLALVTLGFGEIIPQVFLRGENVFGLNVSNGSKGISPTDPIDSLRFTRDGVEYGELGPFDLTSKYLIFVGIAALIVFVSLRLRSGRLGRAWLAIREDELAASAMGVPLMRTKLAAYGIGAACGGLGGVAFATHVNGAFPDRFNFSISITLLAMVVLGGMGNVWGVILGALILAWVNSTGLTQLGNAVNESFGTDVNFSSYNFLMFGLVLVGMMLFRREGLLPEARTRLVLRGGAAGAGAAAGPVSGAGAAGSLAASGAAGSAVVDPAAVASLAPAGAAADGAVPAPPPRRPRHDPEEVDVALLVPGFVDLDDVGEQADPTIPLAGITPIEAADGNGPDNAGVRA